MSNIVSFPESFREAAQSLLAFQPKRPHVDRKVKPVCTLFDRPYPLPEPKLSITLSLSLSLWSLKWRKL